MSIELPILSELPPASPPSTGFSGEAAALLNKPADKKIQTEEKKYGNFFRNTAFVVVFVFLCILLFAWIFHPWAFSASGKTKNATAEGKRKFSIKEKQIEIGKEKKKIKQPANIPPAPAISLNSTNPCLPFLSGRLDIVYTWVDGGDENFLRHLNFYKRLKHSNNRTRNNAFGSSKNRLSANAGRFRDFEELKYSIRSLVRNFQPFINNIYIITDGQIPPYLNFSKTFLASGTPPNSSFPTSSNHRVELRLFSHRQLSPEEDRPFLPIFNSNAIETILHKIPGLTERFLYLNNDFLLFQPVTPEDFFSLRPSEDEGICLETMIFYQGRKMAGNRCKKCAQWRLQDHRCSIQCFNQKCPQDAGKCQKILQERKISLNQTSPGNSSLSLGQLADFQRARDSSFLAQMDWNPVDLTKSVYINTLNYNHALFNVELSTKRKTRQFARHIPALLQIPILEALHRRFPIEFQRTRHSRFRTPFDVQLYFSYIHYIIHLKESGEIRQLAKTVENPIENGGGRVRLEYSIELRQDFHRVHANRVRSAMDFGNGFTGWQKKWDDFLRKPRDQRPLFGVFQDEFGDSGPSKRDVQFIRYVLNRLFPRRSPFEQPRARPDDSQLRALEESRALERAEAIKNN